MSVRNFPSPQGEHRLSGSAAATGNARRPRPGVVAMRLAAVLLFAAALVPVALAGCDTPRSERKPDRGGGKPEVVEEFPLIRSRNAEGAVLFAVVGDELRAGGPRGEVAFLRDGKSLRRGHEKGKRFLHIEEGVVRAKNDAGEIVYCFVGKEIRVGPGEHDAVLFTWRGTDVRRADREAHRLLYVTPGTPRWAVACALYEYR